VPPGVPWGMTGAQRFVGSGGVTEVPEPGQGLSPSPSSFASFGCSVHKSTHELLGGEVGLCVVLVPLGPL